MEALRIATDGVPRFYGETAAYGGVEPGSAADLVLLDKNPLTDIHNTRRVAAVWVEENGLTVRNWTSYCGRWNRPQREIAGNWAIGSRPPRRCR